MFGAAGVEHMQRYGTTAEQFAKIGEKNHRHSVNNPYAQFQDEYTLDDVKAAKMIYAPAELTRLQCSPTSDGSGAVIVASEAFVEKHGLAAQAVEIVGQAMVTDLESTFTDKSAITIVGADMTRQAARKVYEQAEIGPRGRRRDRTARLLLGERTAHLRGARALRARAKAASSSTTGRPPTAARWVVNPSGGLISKGHPLGATGLAQASELTWQLRGTADKRQVPGAALKSGVALQHNIGLGGAVVVTAYRPADR